MWLGEQECLNLLYPLISVVGKARGIKMDGIRQPSVQMVGVDLLTEEYQRMGGDHLLLRHAHLLLIFFGSGRVIRNNGNAPGNIKADVNSRLGDDGLETLRVVSRAGSKLAVRLALVPQYGPQTMGPKKLRACSIRG